MKLFPVGYCEICGLSGVHPDCERKAAESELLYRTVDAELLQRYSVAGCYGPSTFASSESLAEASSALRAHLDRDLCYDPSQAVEGHDWWFIPEGWIGVIGFIVQKSDGKIFCLGSGLVGLKSDSSLYAHWAGIDAYFHGGVRPESTGNGA